MRLPLAVAAASLALLAPHAARAEPEVAVRLALAPAFGSASEDVAISEAVSLQLPLQLEALWRHRSVAAGAYASRGWGSVESCAGSCSAVVWRAGLQATFTFAPLRGAEPWAGVASGYEWAAARREGRGGEITTTWRGWEPLAVQGGVEWRLARAIAVGPFVLLGLGRYGDLALEGDSGSASAPIARRAIHGWVHVGARGRITLGRREER